MSATTPILSLSRDSPGMPFEIHTMQWIDQNRWEQNSAPHRHDYFVIIWLKSGSGVHLIDLDKYDLQPGTVYCISPGQVHQLKSSGPVDGYVISFRPEFMALMDENFELFFNAGLFSTYCQSPVIKIDPESATEMDDIAAKMIKEYSNYFLLRSQILRGYMKIFLIFLTRQFELANEEESQSKNITLVKRFLSSVEKHYISKRMVTDYAGDLAVTPNYLNEVVKKITGYTASHHIQQRIILEAKRQVAYSNLSMKEVAYQLGFDDIAHFSKFFKNASGQSFTDFRKSL
ncbi:helix-turn-helix domain-containing protein [Flavihumibacter solisilvae]|uniref:AraC family transcriptional regulator n=1 Tax=Flavihumibacter solisilvae TaxID=1349421 RepID=A0A0C1LH39_9BACT|nr:helix-turn-helix transcriptional regulator [Flavihumibacter solisilvae]KIC94628.1 AraC family transcriptional regulator [Flavihumibacter solisilvae]